MTRPTIEDLWVLKVGDQPSRPASRSVLLAALGLVIECEECGGTGEFEILNSGFSADLCLPCFGLGYQVAPELVELVYQTNPGAGRENAEQLLRQVFEKEEK